MAIVDDVAFLAKIWKEAEQHIEKLEKQSAKIALKISFEKTKISTNIKNFPNFLIIGSLHILYKTEKMDNFNYVGEWISWNSLDKKPLAIRANKMELAFQLTKSTYNKDLVILLDNSSCNSKFRHYKTVIKPEALYAALEAAALGLRNKGLLENLEQKERKLIRKILGPTLKNYQTKLIPNNEFYAKIEKLSDKIRKRLIVFHSNLVGTDNNILNK